MAKPAAFFDMETFASARAADRTNAALVCMPFASAERPSIQIGLLSAIAEQAGFPTDSHYFNLDLAAEISPALYEHFCEHRGEMTGEWLFAPAAFGKNAPSSEDSYFEAFPSELTWFRELGKEREFITALRRRILPQFIEKCLESVNWSKYQLVGFTSTFQQNVASLALARRIKERYPSTKIVFGGANMDAEMGPEYIRAFSFLDYVVVGEGEHAFPSLLRQLARGAGLAPIAGVVTQGCEKGYKPAPLTTDLSALPTPNYDVYFDRAIELGLLSHYRTLWTLPFESSRGCWWGQKHHCTFCGLNGLGMPFRSKTPERLLREIAELTRKHRITSFTAVDNILDQKYIRELFPYLADHRIDAQFFYEVKANLTRHQIETLYRGGVRRIQPGIESMSTHVLELMRKGSSMLQNVRCLKWCLYYGIQVAWNLIWGFPGETEEDYARELQVLRCIGHLEPPISCSRIWLERFSPHHFDARAFGIRNVRAKASYRHVYTEQVDIEKIAYFFDYEAASVLPASAHRPTQQWIEQWQESWRSGKRKSLTYRRTLDGLFIDFDWGPDRKGTYSLSAVFAAMYEYCVEDIRSVSQVARYLSKMYSVDFAMKQVKDTLEEFCDRRLMIGENERYLSLAIPTNPNWYSIGKPSTSSNQASAPHTQGLPIAPM